ncbi:MAG: inositol monophosphatase [Desulfurococcaceae archaeon]|nr:MAG: inositol monophosphatase [Desulfurococcaceae archaeon]
MGEPAQDRGSLADLYRLVVSIAVEGAKYARERSGDQNMFAVLSKNPTGDDTRRIDKAVEDHILEEIKSRGVGALVITEETGSLVIGGREPEYIFLLDPLDGSINYVADIPYCSVSLAALPYKAGASLNDVVVGVVAEIFRDRSYSFLKGLGAYVNNEPAYGLVSEGPSVILAYFEEPDLVGRIHKLWFRLGKPKIRSLGSASLDIINVSMGRFRAFIDLRGRLRNIDVAAAIGFAKELGAFVIDDRGDEINIPADRLSRIGSIIVSREKSIIDIVRDS